MEALLGPIYPTHPAPGDSIRGGFRGMGTRQFAGHWIDLMESVEAAVASGEPRAEVMAWAEADYADYEGSMNSQAASEAGEFDTPVFDVQGRL